MAVRTNSANRLRLKAFAGVAAAAGLLAAVPSTAPAAVASLDDVTDWTGTGPNRAALVVDWNDGKAPQSIAWGYRWTGSATAADMLLAVVAADPLLYAKVGTPGGFGLPVYGIGRDLNGNGFGLDDNTAFDAQGRATTSSGSAANSPVDDAKPTDPADHYEEGWWSEGFWNHYQSATSPYAAGGQWASGLGVSSQSLTNGAWAGLSYAPGFAGSVPDAPVNTPEPATAAAAGAAAAGLLARRRRGRAA